MARLGLENLSSQLGHENAPISRLASVIIFSLVYIPLMVRKNDEVVYNGIQQ